ncbi:alpha-galactosidase [Agromyces sp. CF514]|uniref:alpha-galactosidase n=1 Tax=Agromyces sp. CF514 TaxID=1881031 RepID=UPI0008E33D60|nr:alpha-galactosidase [Agromyces sp. CF514]SFR70495.1 alpha-galactosidase [Agromyces sp. CF514]
MIHHLCASGVSVLVDARGTGVPAIVHWGRDLGELDDAALAALADAVVPAVSPSSIDVPLRLSLAPSLADGWSGRPGLAVAGERPVDLALALRSCERIADSAGDRLAISVTDAAASVDLAIALELTPQGVLRMRHVVTNVGEATLHLGAAASVVPVPDRARELLDFSGLWANERRPQRLTPGHGVWTRESRHGRPGHDDAFLLAAGTPGFGFRTGEVWAAHVAWSGDRALWFERSALGPTTIGGGELLGLGEVVLAEGETYDAPWLVLAWSDAGLDGVSARLHPWVRSWSTIDRPRPVVLNTWEAVYFDQSLDGLQPLIDAAAEVGVERFVLDDGWFRGRTDDRRALGDWFVDAGTWPDGLGPLIDRVVAAGMDFGLWVEPEMVSRDSDVAREHPDWVLQPVGAPTWRWQNTLDLANPAAFAYLFERLDALLSEHPIASLKWDHNRDLLAIDAHRQTRAFLRLVDAVRAAHPEVEIESCASGGARIDLGVLERVERVWTSDTNDPLVRQRIQRFTSLVVPPEYLGGHLGAAHAHTTGRSSSLSFRMITALFGSAGIEWNLAEAAPHEREAVAGWIALFKRERGFLHSGVVVRGDDADPGVLGHGVVAPDGSRALYARVALDSAETALPAPARIPGLDPDRRYRVRPVEVGGPPPVIADAPPPWWAAGEVVLSGRVLGETGLAMPLLAPENALLLEVTAV